MKYRWLKDHRGSVLIFTIFLLLLLLIMGGFAIDLAYVATARRQLQRSMDSASLAGAGNLGFDATAFPAARGAAQQYATLNGYSAPGSGTITLNQNLANLSNGDIILGVWDGAGFTPSLDGSVVNAVQTQVARTIPTSFLRIMGINNLPVAAQAIAVSNPPETIPPDTCVFPIALSCCAFGCNSSSSVGCGSPITFITSSGQGDCIAPPCTNTATWANQCSTSTPNVPTMIAAINAAASGQTCSACNTDGTAQVGTNNGMQQAVFDILEDQFLLQYNNGGWYKVKDSAGALTYEGPGWEVFVPVINTVCPAQAITGTNDVVGWTNLVITEVVNHGTCVANNPYDSQMQDMCPDTGQPAMRAVFGYYECTLIPSVGSRNPGVRSALGTNLRLVQ